MGEGEICIYIERGGMASGEKQGERERERERWIDSEIERMGG